MLIFCLNLGENRSLIWLESRDWNRTLPVWSVFVLACSRGISCMIGIPNAVTLHLVSPFKDLPCRDEDVLFDLSTCRPSWNEEFDVTFIIMKVGFKELGNLASAWRMRLSTDCCQYEGYTTGTRKFLVIAWIEYDGFMTWEPSNLPSFPTSLVHLSFQNSTQTPNECLIRKNILMIMVTFVHLSKFLMVQVHNTFYFEVRDELRSHRSSFSVACKEVSARG